MRPLTYHLATVGGLGDRLPAPGTTVGSVVGALLFAAAAAAWPHGLVVAAVLGFVALLPISVWASGEEAKRRGNPDPNPAVIDEVIGQWLALGVLAVARPQPPSLGALAVSFALFRVFDVVKPWPIRALERLPGGFGIVADDLAAGLAAGLLQLVLLRFP